MGSRADPTKPQKIPMENRGLQKTKLTFALDRFHKVLRGIDLSLETRLLKHGSPIDVSFIARTLASLAEYSRSSKAVTCLKHFSREAIVQRRVSMFGSSVAVVMPTFAQITPAPTYGDCA